MNKPLDSHGEHPYADAGQLILLGIFLIIWGGDWFFLHLSTFLTDYLPWYIRIIFLVSCLAAAAFLIKSSHGIVSHSQRSRGLVSTGAFKYVRHPLYLRCLLVYLGLVLSTASLFSLVFWLAICIFYNYLASYEEKLLKARFGESYIIYQEQTGKWTPRRPFIYRPGLFRKN